MSRVRSDLSKVARNAYHMLSRSTIRKVDTKHLAPQASHLDGFHSQTDTDVEIQQGWGVIGVPLDQEEESNQQGQKQQDTSQGDWNHNQPKGKAAELITMRVGSQSHPVAFPVADRRVQPYGMKAGESAHYSMSGTGQMLFHNDKGSYLVVTNNEPEQSKSGGEQPERFASMRHVEKKKQPREIKEDQQEDPKHEGETVNTEVRATKSKIEFRVGDQVVAYFDAGKFVVLVECLLGDEDKEQMKQVFRREDVDDAGNKPAKFAQKVWAK